MFRTAKLLLSHIGGYLYLRTGGERHYIDVDFVCEAPTGEAQLCEPEKCEGWAWYELAALPQPLFIVTQRMIESLRSGTLLRDPAEIERQ